MFYLVFTTTTCPKCPAFTRALHTIIPDDGKIIDETFPEFDELVQKYSVTAVPHCIAFTNIERADILWQANDVSELIAHAPV